MNTAPQELKINFLVQNHKDVIEQPLRFVCLSFRFQGENSIKKSLPLKILNYMVINFYLQKLST